MLTSVKPSSFKVCILAVSLSLGLAACGERKEEKKAATQVAAKVNGSEISVHQINAVLSRANGVTAETADRAKKEILSKLIDQQLVFDQALEKKLDRTPEVMMAIEAAKREIVARAYMDQLASALPKPTDADASKYYAENPGLFSRRRIYNLQELTVEGRPGVAELLKQMVAAGKSTDDMTTRLKADSIPFRAGGVTRPAEQVPLDILPRLVELKDGQSAVFSTGENQVVIRVLGSQAAAVDESEARPRILQFLHNQQIQKMAEAELGKLKAAAKIEYQGEFATASAKPAAAVPTVATVPAKTGNTPNLEKGVAGLK